MSQQSPCPTPHKDPQRCGAEMTAHRRHFRCFDAQLEDQTQHCIPHSPDDVTSCLCSSPWLGHAPRRPAWTEEALAARPQVRRQRKRVVLVRNSDPTVRRNISLNPRALRSLRLFLEEVSELLHFRVHKLYTLDGHKIDSTHTLLQCPSVLVCVGREPFHPLQLQTFRGKPVERLPPVSPTPRCVVSARGPEAVRDANLGLETKQTIIHPRSDSTTRTRRTSLSSEKSFPKRLSSTSLGNSGFPGACRQIKDSLSGDDIEKRVIVHENGSLSLEMKVRFHLLNNEVLHWSTEVKKSAGAKTDTGCNCCQINSESCSETELISAYEAQDADMTRLYQRHLEDPHCQHCCAQCLEYEIWKSQMHSNLQTVQHIRSSGSSTSSHTFLCKKSSVDSMSTMSLSSEEYVEQMVEKIEKGDATVEYCTISHCYSHSEVCAVTTASKSQASTREEHEYPTNNQTCGATRPVSAGSVRSRGSQTDQLSVTITQVSDEDDRPVSAISNSSHVLQMLKDDRDDDSDLPPSISQASSYSHLDNSEDDRVKSVSPAVCKYASPMHHLTPRPHDKTPASSGHSTRSTKSRQAALTNQVVNSFEKCENGTKESETRTFSVMSPNSNASANSKKSDKSNCRSCGGVITPHSVESHYHGQAKDEKVEAISLVSLATADDEGEERVTGALSTQSDRSQTPTRSINSKAPEEAEHEVGVEEQAENRSQSTSSNKSRISRKSVNSEMSGKIAEANSGEETTQDRVPSALSAQSNTSAGLQESGGSESEKHERGKESEIKEHRAASSLSANSNVSIRSRKSKGSDKAEDEVDCEEQVRDRARSTLSVISDTSTRSRKSKMSEKWQEESGKEKGNTTDICESERETRSLRLSPQSANSDISPGSTSSRISDKAQEWKEGAEEIGTRAQSATSCKSCASTRSRTSKVSEKAAHAIEREGKDGGRAQSNLSMKSHMSMRSRESQVSTKAGDKSRAEEPSQDACSVKSHPSVRASELQASVISPEVTGEGEDYGAGVSRGEGAEHLRPISALSSKSNASEKSVSSEWSEAVIELNTDEEETQTRAPSNLSGESHTSKRSRKSKASENADVKSGGKEPPQCRAPSSLSVTPHTSSRSRISKLSERGKEHGEEEKDITNDFGEEKDENRSLSALSTKPDFLVRPSKATISEKDTELNAEEEKQEEGTKAPRSLSVTSCISSASGKSLIGGKVEDQNGGEEPSQNRASSSLSIRSCNSARSRGSKVKPEVAKAGKEEAENRTPSVLSSQTNASERVKKSSTLHCRSCGRPNTPHSIPNSGSYAIEGAEQEVYAPAEDRDEVVDPAADTEEAQIRDQTASSISSVFSARSMTSTTAENLRDVNQEEKPEGHEDTASTASNSMSKSSVPQKMSPIKRDENGTSEDVDGENRVMSGASDSFAVPCLRAAVEMGDRESSSASISQESRDCERVCSAESVLRDACIAPDGRNVAQRITASENQPKDTSTNTAEANKERAGSALSTKSKKSNQTQSSACERHFTPTTTLVSTGLVDEQESAAINEKSRESTVSVSSQASAQSINSASIASSHHKKCPTLSVGSKMADDNEVLQSDENSDDRPKSAASTRMEASEQNDRGKKGSHLNAENDRASSSMSKSSRGSVGKSRDLQPPSEAPGVSSPSEEATKDSSNQTLQKAPSRGVSSASEKSSAGKSKLIDNVSTVMKDSYKMSNHSPTLQVTEFDIKSVDKNENSSICSVKSSNSNKYGSPTISVTSPNKLGPCSSKGSPKKTKTPKVISDTSNDGIASQTDFQQERIGNSRPATSQSKSNLSDHTSSDTMGVDCIKHMTCSKSSRSSRCRHRKHMSPSQKKEIGEDMSELAPSSLPNTSPTEVVNEWLKKIPSDGSMYKVGDELNENSDEIKMQNQMESAAEPIHQELGKGAEEASQAAEEQISAAEPQGSAAEVLIGEENNKPCHEEQTAAEIPKTDLPNQNLSAEPLPTTFHSSVQLMRALLCPKLYRCNSLPEVSHIYGKKLSNSAKELLDCLTSLQLIDSGSLGINAKNAKYEEVMSLLQSLWLTCPSDCEYQKIQKKNLRKEQSGEDGFTPRSSSGVDISSGSAGSGNGSISLIHKIQTAAEGRTRDYEDLCKLSEETEGNEGVENCAVFSPQSVTDEETHVSDPATSDIASQEHLTPQRAGMLPAEEKLIGEEGPASSKTTPSNELPSSSITSSANGPKALKLLVETEADPPEDTRSGTPPSELRIISQDIDPVWVLNFLNKIEKKFMTHYMNAMTEFKSRWNLEDNEHLDTMINELRDEVHVRIRSSIDREMKKIHAGKIPRPPEKSSSQESSVQSIRRRRQLKTMLFRSNDAQKSDDSTVSDPDFSGPQSEEEYCPCESCMNKKTTLLTAAHLEGMSSAPVVMDFDLKKVLNLRKEIPANIQEEECGAEESDQYVAAENGATQAGKWSGEEGHGDGKDQEVREKEETFDVKMEAAAVGSQEDGDKDHNFDGHFQRNNENVVVNAAETITESFIEVNGAEMMNEMKAEDNETVDKASEEVEMAGGDTTEATGGEMKEGDTTEAEEGERAEGDTAEAEGETAEGDAAEAEGETTEGDTAEAEGETAEGDTAEAEGETAEGEAAEAKECETAEGDTADAEEDETAEGDTAEAEEDETAEGDTAEAEESETAKGDTAEAKECETAEGDTAEAEEGETAEGEFAEAEGETTEGDTAEAEGETAEGEATEAKECETAKGDTAEAEEGETAEGDTTEAEESETAEGDTAEAEEGETAEGNTAEAEEDETAEGDTAEAEEDETAKGDTAEAEEDETAEGDTAEAEEGETAEGDTAEAEEGETAEGDTAEAEGETAEGDTAEVEEDETADEDTAEAEEHETAEGDTAEAEEGETAEGDTAEAEGETAEGDTAEVEEGETAEGETAEAEEDETAEGDTAEAEEGETAEGDTAEAEEGETAEGDTAEAEGETAEGDTAEVEEDETADEDTAEAEEDETAEGDTAEAEEGETAEGDTAEAEGETAEGDTAEVEEGETAEGETAEVEEDKTADGDTAEAEEDDIAEGDTAEAEEGETAEGNTAEAEGETAEGDTTEAEEGKTAEGDTAEAEEDDIAEGDTGEAEEGETADGDTAEAEGKTAEGDTAEAEGETAEGNTAEAEGETAEGDTAEAEDSETAEGDTFEAEEGETAEGDTAEAEECETADGDTAEAEEGETAEGVTAEAEEGDTAEGDTAEAEEGKTAEGNTADAEEDETAEGHTAEAEEGETAEGDTAEAEEDETAEGDTAEAEEGDTAEGDTAEAEDGETAEGNTADAEEGDTAEGDTAEAEEGETAEGNTAEAEEGDTAEGDTAEAEEGETAEGDTAEAEEDETAEEDTAEAEEGETAEGDTAEAEEDETAEGDTAEAEEGETAEGNTAEAEEGETAEGDTAEAEENEIAEGDTAEAEEGDTAEGDTAEAEEGDTAEGDTAEAEEDETAEGDTAEAEEGDTAEGDTAEAEEGETAEGDTVEAEEGDTAEGDTAEAEEGETAEGDTVEAEEGDTAEGDTAEAEEDETAEGDTAEAEEGETAEGDTVEAEEGETAEGDTAESEEGETAEGDTAEAEEDETAEGDTAEAEEDETAEGDTAEAEEGETAEGDTAEAEEGDTAEGDTAEAEEGDTAEGDTAEAEEGDTAEGDTAEAEEGDTAEGDTAEAEEGETAEGDTAEAEEGDTAEGDTAEAEEDEPAEGDTAEAEENETAEAEEDDLGKAVTDERAEAVHAVETERDHHERCDLQQGGERKLEKNLKLVTGEDFITEADSQEIALRASRETLREDGSVEVEHQMSALSPSSPAACPSASPGVCMERKSSLGNSSSAGLQAQQMYPISSEESGDAEQNEPALGEKPPEKKLEPNETDIDQDDFDF